MLPQAVNERNALRRGTIRSLGGARDRGERAGPGIWEAEAALTLLGAPLPLWPGTRPIRGGGDSPPEALVRVRLSTHRQPRGRRGPRAGDAPPRAPGLRWLRLRDEPAGLALHDPLSRANRRSAPRPARPADV